ncbi:MAG: hypothetical protein KDK24_18590 [Pseudooceanicola sp.]|nr:hypothetical protein [Pseudooceanicola sp.]
MTRLFSFLAMCLVLAGTSVPAQQAQTFRGGDPLVMIVAGGAETIGSARSTLSPARVTAVAGALSARGIPVERLQVLGRGTSGLAVRTGPASDEPRNRFVEVSWR